LYSFLGANPEFMLKEEGEIVVLDTNYRNTQNILNEAQRLITKNLNRQHKEIKIIKNTSKGEIIHLDMYGRGEQELIQMIKRFEGRTFILARTNYQVNKIADMLDIYSIPYLHIRGRSPWSDVFVAVYSALKKIKEEKNPTFTGEEIRNLAELLPAKEFFRHGAKKTLVKMTEPISLKELKKLYFKALDLATLPEFDDMIKQEPINIFNSARDHLTSERQKHILDIAEKTGYAKIETPINCYLGTFHSSKALEAKNVFLVDSLPKKVSNEIIGNMQTMEEERRVYFVAITRAENNLIYVYNLFSNCKSFLKFENQASTFTT